MDFIFKDEKYDLPEGIIRIEVNGFTPGRPAPVCSNPDSPLFSDPGDEAEFEELLIYVNIAGIEVSLEDVNPELFYQVEDKIIDRIFDLCFMEYEKEKGEYYD